MSDWWLLLEAMWPPLKKAITISLGIVLALKTLVKLMLWCLKRGDKKPRGKGEGEPEAEATSDGGGEGEGGRVKAE